jgi:hypothetical protein
MFTIIHVAFLDEMQTRCRAVWSMAQFDRQVDARAKGRRSIAMRISQYTTVS